MTMIEPSRRVPHDGPHSHDAPDSGEQFGADLAAAVSRRDTDRAPRARTSRRATDDAASTPEVAHRKDRPLRTASDAAIEATEGESERAEPVASTDEPVVELVPSDEPRINNGGVCSCCTPGAFRVAMPATSTATPDATIQPPLVESIAGTSMPIDGPAPRLDAELDLASTPAATPLSADPSAPRSEPSGAVPTMAETPLAIDSVVAAAADLVVEAVGTGAAVSVAPEARSDDDRDDASIDPAAQAATAVVATVVMSSATSSSTDPTSPTIAVVGSAAGAMAAQQPSAAATDDDTATDDDAPAALPIDGDAAAVTPSQQNGADLASSRISAAVDAPVTTTAPLRGQSVSEGVLRSEHVRVLRELAPNRDVQRLAVELDGARVALRFDSAGARVNVVADPGNRLGQGWADDVQRTLNAGAREGSAFQQRDPDGGRRNRQAYEAPNQTDERRAAEFSARLGAVEEG